MTTGIISSSITSNPIQAHSPARIDCSICRDDLVNVTTILPCEHQFNLECILTWLETSGERSRKCPLCRTQMSMIHYQTEDGGSEIIEVGDARPDSGSESESDSDHEPEDENSDEDEEEAGPNTETEEEADEEIPREEPQPEPLNSQTPEQTAFEQIKLLEIQRILAIPNWKSPLWNAVYMDACILEGEYYTHIQRSFELRIEQTALKTTSQLKRTLSIERKHKDTPDFVPPFRFLGASYDVDTARAEADRILAMWPRESSSDNPRRRCGDGLSRHPTRGIATLWEKYIHVEKYPDSPGSVKIMWDIMFEEHGPTMERHLVDSFPISRGMPRVLEKQARQCRDEIKVCFDWLKYRHDRDTDHGLEEGTTNLLEAYDGSYQCGYCDFYHRHGYCLLPWGVVETI